MDVPKNTPLVLIVRDGWGQNPHPEHDAFNAVKLAKTPDEAERLNPVARPTGDRFWMLDAREGIPPAMRPKP